MGCWGRSSAWGLDGIMSRLDSGEAVSVRSAMLSEAERARRGAVWLPVLRSALVTGMLAMDGLGPLRPAASWEVKPAEGRATTSGRPESMGGTSRHQRRSRRAAAAAAAVSAIVALSGCQSGSQSSAAGGPGCPPLPSSSLDIYPYSTAAGAGEIRVSPLGSSIDVDGDTVTFTITACSGPVNWSVSAPSYVTVHPRSGTLRTGQQVRVQASYDDPGANTKFTVNPGDYVLGTSYNYG